MKIGFFTDTYFPQINGVTYTVSSWKNELEKLGHEVYVYYPDDEKYAPGKNEVPLKSVPFLFYKGYNIGLPSFKRISKDLDIVHVHGFVSMATLGLAVGRKKGIPCVLTYHTPADMYLQQISNNEIVQESLGVVYKMYEKELLERCQMITAPTKEIIDFLKDRWGDKIQRSAYFSNGIDTGFFKEVNCKKFKEEYKIPKGRVIGFTGRHSSEKHLEDLINFADKFDGTIVLGGDGKQHEMYKKMAEGKKNIIFTGFFPRERLPEFYSCIDVFVMPSTAETEGLVVLEANACGKPAVGADALGLKTTIQEGVNGYRYEPGDMNDLGKKIDKAYEDLNKLKTSSKLHAEERSLHKTAEGLVRMYEELIRSGAGRHNKDSGKKK